MKKFLVLLMALTLGLALCVRISTNEQAVLEHPYVNRLYRTLQNRMDINFMKQDVDHLFIKEDEASVYLSNCRYLDSEYLFQLGNGTTLQLPMTYGQLCDAGWMLEYDSIPDPYPAEQIQWFSFMNSNGKTIGAEIANLSDAPMDVRDARVAQISLGDAYTEHFSLNGIGPGATVKQILEVFGLPHGCIYYEWSWNDISFFFYYIDETNMIHLTFDIDARTNRLSGITFSHLLP